MPTARTPAKKPQHPDILTSAPLDEGPEAPDKPRYSWAQIRKKVKHASPEELEIYRVRIAPTELVKRGAQLRSERILTDMRTWLGQIIDWWSKQSAAQRAEIVGFSDARLRVVTHHAFVLQDLVARAAHPAQTRIDHAGAVARNEAAYAAAQHARQMLRAALDGASPMVKGWAAQVATADVAAGDPVKLPKTLKLLVGLGTKALTANKEVAAVLRADGLDEAALARFAALGTALTESHEQVRGAAATGDVSQADLDLQDGVCLQFMSQLRGVFANLRAQDRGAPLLLARSTHRVFGSGRRAESVDPAADGSGKAPVSS